MEHKQSNQYGDEKHHKGGGEGGEEQRKEGYYRGVWQKKKLFLDTHSWISEVTQWKGVDKLILQNDEAQRTEDDNKMIIWFVSEEN